MSNHLISTTYKRDLRTPMRKSVMALLADKASDDGSGIYASKQTMADELCCSKQAILDTIKGFLQEGLLAEIGQRRSATGFTVEYGINVEALEALPLVKCHADRAARGSTKLTGQPAGPVNDIEGRGQPAGPKPSLNPIPSEASASSVKRTSTKVAFPAPDGVPAEAWLDFLTSPKRRKAGMSGTAYAGILNNLTELAEHGFPPGKMIALAVERGWTTVKLEWVQNDERSQANRGSIGRLGGSGPSATLRIRQAAAAAEREDAENYQRSWPSLPAAGHG